MGKLLALGLAGSLFPRYTEGYDSKAEGLVAIHKDAGFCTSLLSPLYLLNPKPGPVVSMQEGRHSERDELGKWVE